jgi:membrane protease YdiL (CAAX protease family)
MTFSAANIVASLEIALAVAGAVLGWRLFLRPAAKIASPPPRLARWETTLPDFLVFIVFVIGGSIVCAVFAGLLSKGLGLRGDAVTVLAGAGAQLGMLGGACIYWARPDRGRPVAIASGSVLISGAVTFLISLPLLLLSANLWEVLLKALKLPTEKQSMIAMFANADSPLLLALMILLAVVIAPLTEELVFRAGLFRFLRGRVPRWVALAGPGLIFASLHVNWSSLEGLTSLAPLVVLAVMFSLAYEYTGSICTPIVAHALFNLNTVLLIFSGVGL